MFYRTAGPSHKAWYWNHGLRWQTSLVCRSRCKWHAMCSIRLLQCALCCFIFIEYVVLRSCTANCGTSSIFKSQMAVGFWNAIRTDVSFGVFIIYVKGVLFFILLSCFKQCVLGLSGLLGLNAVIILPLYCNAIIVWSLEMFAVRQTFISMLAKRGTVLCVDVLGTTLMVMMMMSWCLMSSDVIWHIRDKLWPMPKHGSIKATYVRCMRV